MFVALLAIVLINPRKFEKSLLGFCVNSMRVLFVVMYVVCTPTQHGAVYKCFSI